MVVEKLKEFVKYVCSGFKSECRDDHIVLFLQYKDYYLFLPDEGEDRIRYWPVMIPSQVLSNVSNEIERIQEYFNRNFDLRFYAERIKFHYDAISMSPIVETSFNLAVIELNTWQFTNLSKHLKPIHASTVLVEQNSNIFFRFLANKLEAA